MRVAASLHGIVVVRNKEGSFTGAIQVRLGDNPSPVTIFEDEYFDVMTALQDLTKQYAELSNG